MIPPERKQILVVDDEANLRRVLAAQLTRDGYDVHVAEDGEAGLAFLREHHIDLVITDLRMPKLDGMDLLRAALRDEPARPVVMMTAHGTVDTAVEALKTGAFDYVTKPFDQNEVRIVVKKALRTKDLASADATPENEPASRDDAPDRKEGSRFGIIGQSQPILDLYAVLSRVADTPTTVLVTGESGTGKELVARALHENSSRRDRPFIKVNCAAIPKDLMEAELFGYERGAFTGAIASKPGRFELASAGTLFLDEIGELPNDMQVKLLRVLQESEFERVGGIKTMKVDVRLVAATNRDLKKEIASGNFRDDLYYRLNVVPIALPALRERRTDIPLLVSYFVGKFNARLKKNLGALDDDAMEKLVSYGWPGNIRELENVMERAVLFADGTTISAGDLPEDVRHTPTSPGAREASKSDSAVRSASASLVADVLRDASASSPHGSSDGSASSPHGSSDGSASSPHGSSDGSASSPHGSSDGSASSHHGASGTSTTLPPSSDGLKEQVKAAMSRLERGLIERALQQTQGNVTHAARLLKISRKGLQLKMKELGLRERDE